MLQVEGGEAARNVAVIIDVKKQVIAFLIALFQHLFPVRPFDGPPCVIAQIR